MPENGQPRYRSSADGGRGGIYSGDGGSMTDLRRLALSPRSLLVNKLAGDHIRGQRCLVLEVVSYADGFGTEVDEPGIAHALFSGFLDFKDPPVSISLYHRIITTLL